jgi:hypothetical protein
MINYLKQKEVCFMDIPSLSIAMSQSQLVTGVGVALLAKSLSSAETIGDDMVKMMEQSVNPNLGGNIDIRV